MRYFPCLIALLVSVAASSPATEEAEDSFIHGNHEFDYLSDSDADPEAAAIDRAAREAPMQDPGLQFMIIKKWTNNVVPYRFNPGYSDDFKEMIEGAMRELETNTDSFGKPCVRFRPKMPSDYNHIVIAKLDGCYSHVGMMGIIDNIVSLDDDCQSIGIILHELLHTLGFTHEHNRPDRDRYVTVHWDNVLQNYTEDFMAYEAGVVDINKTSYDYGSIMHYSPFGHGKDPSKPTLSAKSPGTFTRGERLGEAHFMSPTDTKKVQQMYGCAVDTSHTHQANTNGRLIDCNFEKDLCGFTQDRDDDFDWSRERGASRTPGTGPATDHSVGSGYYLLGNARGHNGKVARLRYRNLPAGDFCMTVYINSYGYGGTLNIRLFHAGQSLDFSNKYTSSNSREWFYRNETFKMPANWDLILEYTAGTRDTSNMAIDDIRLGKDNQCD